MRVPLLAGGGGLRLRASVRGAGQRIAGNQGEAGGHADSVGQLEGAAAAGHARLQAPRVPRALAQDALVLWWVHRLACTAKDGAEGESTRQMC